MNNKTKTIGIAIGILIVFSIVTAAATGYANIVKTTKSPGYSAMFGNFAEIGADWNPGNPAQIVNVSFYLPVNAYVYVTSSGETSFICGTSGCPGTAQMWIAIDDKDKRADWDTYKFQDSFSISSMYKLKKGYHTAYLMGQPRDDANFGYTSANIVAIATQKGTIGGNSWFVQE